MKRNLLRLGLVLLSLFVATWVGDRVLGLFGYPVRPTIQVAHPPHLTQDRVGLDFNYRFQTNGQGLRYRDIPLEPPAGTYRVFVVGDSFTEGVGVEQNERFTDLLERDFSRPGHGVQFINGGLSGVGPAEYGRIFVNVGIKYHPDGLLICVYANDVMNTAAAYPETDFDDLHIPVTGWERTVQKIWPHFHALVREWIELRKKIHATQTTDLVADLTRQARRAGVSEEKIEAWKKAVPPEYIQAVNAGKLNAHTIADGLLLPGYWDYSIDLSTKTATVKFNHLLVYLSAIVSRARGQGVTPALVYIPSALMYDPREYDAQVFSLRRLSGVIAHRRWLTETTPVQQGLAAWAKSRDLPFLDLTPELRKRADGPRLVLPYDGHWNPEGHRVAAQLIEQWIIRDRVFPLKESGG